MADNRSLRKKLEAMASQSVSPNEAEVARAILAKLHRVAAPGIETPGLVTRASVLASPDRPDAVRAAYRVRTPGGSWLILDEDMMPWKEVEHHHLKWQKL